MNQLKQIGKNLRSMMKEFWEDESGMGTVEVILIIVVLIGLVIAFKTQITGLVEKIFKTINDNANQVTSG